MVRRPAATEKAKERKVSDEKGSKEEDEKATHETKRDPFQLEQ